MSTASTIQIGSQEALALVQNLLPVLEASIPAVGAAAGPIGLGVSGAAVAIPILIKLGQDLAEKGVIDDPTQADQITRFNAVADQIAKLQAGDRTGQPEWKPSGDAPPSQSPPPTAPPQ
jgi:hypothetical protein